MNQIKKNRNAEKKIDEDKCFVIMPISSQDGYDDGHFQLVYEDIIKPSILAANLQPSRADETKNTNLIQLDILRSIIDSPIAICDMSAKNPNVFYELGMRQAFDMPTVLLKDESTNAPFDISGLRYVTYNSDMKHRNVVQAVKDLTEALIDTFNKRGDKAEINSLIRLMELAAPAKLGQVEISEELRYEKVNQLHLEQILSSIESLHTKQNSLVNQIRADKERERERDSEFQREVNLDIVSNLVKNSNLDTIRKLKLSLDKKNKHNE